MQSIFCLAHFCDLHGPKTLFCTQAFKFVDIKPNRTDLNSSKSSSSNTSISSLNSSNVTCKACRAFEKTFVHYISYDNNSKICYISQSTPSDSEVFALVRKACLRTLHCEVFEDPIYFDDDKNGSVIGYEFHVKDSQGRGFQRSYSLLIIMKDRIYLQHLWAFLQDEMSKVAAKIKAAAQNVYDNEIKENQVQFLHHHHSTPSGTNTGNIFKKSPNRSNRGLIELTNDNLIFSKLHMWFTWILRASACQITEEFLHGPVVEDIQVKIEQMKEENDLFGSNKYDSLNEDNIEIDNLMFKFDSYKDLTKIIGYESFHLLAYNTIVGNQVIIRCKYQQLVKSTLKLLEQLIPFGCRRTKYYSNIYINSYESNLLGLSEEFNLNNADSEILNDFILLNLQVLPICNQSSMDLSNYAFKVDIKTNNRSINQDALPEVLIKMEKYIFNDLLDSNSVNQLINWTREEWLKYFNCVYKHILLYFRLLIRIFYSKAKVFYKFAKTNSPSNKNQNNVKLLLQFLKLDKKDELSLKFWQTGLSNDCKSLIRATTAI